MNLYPKIEPFKSDFLQVSDIHKIYYEESGNRDGKPILFLHGGPGFGTTPRDRRFFNPEKYRIIMFDQRGSGKSTPQGSLKENTTKELIGDIEKLREHLNIDKWLVFGGSWGTTLALVYAESYPEKVNGLILRSVFTMTNWEMDWYFREGVNRIFPDFWNPLINTFNETLKQNVLESLFEQVVKGDKEVQARAISLFDALFFKTTDINSEKEIIPNKEVSEFLVNAYKILLHYFKNMGFLEKNQIILDSSKIQNIPVSIIHGRADMVCPLAAAWDLHKSLPNSTLEIVQGAGHGTGDGRMIDAIVRNTDKFADKKI
ncbi:prolyl aminopeptidase [Patescibacteria group bacterium]